MLGYPVMDTLASLFICLFILKVSYDIMCDTFSKLLDTSSGAEYERKLSAFISAQSDVVKIDLLQTRMFGNKIYVDLEISLNGSLSLKEAHEIAENVHAAVEQTFPEVKHIMIHVNPA